MITFAPACSNMAFASRATNNVLYFSRVRPLTPVAPGSTPPWPASRTTVRPAKGAADGTTGPDAEPDSEPEAESELEPGLEPALEPALEAELDPELEPALEPEPIEVSVDGFDADPVDDPPAGGSVDEPGKSSCATSGG